MTHTMVRAIRMATDQSLDGLLEAGAFQFEATERGMFYMCPCGCGALGYLGFRDRTEPPRPSWEWDGNREMPTLSPSIRRTGACKWHGYLKAGTWMPEGDSGQ